MKRVLSYLWPITKYIESAINGTLEITWINGKKILDTKNTNFSYGSLQRILKFALLKTDVSHVSEILVLGLGAGSVIQTLRKDLDYSENITAIEIDKVIIAIAENEFNLSNNENLEIVACDAFSYVKNAKKIFGIIIIDLFIDKDVQTQCFSFDFWKTLTPLVEAGGYVIFNAGFNQTDIKKIDEIMEDFKLNYDFQKFEKVENTNTLLIGKKLPSTLA